MLNWVDKCTVLVNLRMAQNRSNWDMELVLSAIHLDSNYWLDIADSRQSVCFHCRMYLQDKENKQKFQWCTALQYQTLIVRKDRMLSRHNILDIQCTGK